MTAAARIIEHSYLKARQQCSVIQANTIWPEQRRFHSSGAFVKFTIS